VLVAAVVAVWLGAAVLAVVLQGATAQPPLVPVPFER